ncbi:MAG: divergent polysaccharide deacetylase family protein [Pseudomonadota bacterium]
MFSRRQRESLKSTVWGGAWGVVVGGAIIAVSSQLAARHELLLPQPEARAVETPAGTEFDQARPETDPAVPGEETVPAADIAAVTPSTPATQDMSPLLDTQPAAAPEPVYAGPVSPDRPEVPAQAGIRLTDRLGLRPEVSGAPEAAAPLPPGIERPVAVSRDVPAPPVREPAQKTASNAPNPAPDAERENGLGGEPQNAALAGSGYSGLADTTAPADQDLAVNQPVGEGMASDSVAETTEADDLAAEEASPPMETADGTVAEQETAPEIETAAKPEETPMPQVVELAPAPVAPAIAGDTETALNDGVAQIPNGEAPSDAAPAPAPQLTQSIAGAPAADISSEAEAGITLAEADTALPSLSVPRAPSGETGRPLAPRLTDVATVPELPASGPGPSDVATEEPRRIGLEEPEPEESFEIAQAPTADAALPGVPAAQIGQRSQDLPGQASGAAPAMAKAALVENRRSFDAATEGARLAVILVHESAAPPDPAEIGDLPGEVSFAVDAGSANAAAIASAYRTQGREVVMIPSIPVGARAQDVEVALQANLQNVDAAVAVIDVDGRFQNDREAVGQVVAVLVDTGHGLVTAQQGLDTAGRIAGRFGVPAALIFGDLGDAGDARAVGRALDRIAFRARQEEGIILLGRADSAAYEGIETWMGSRQAEGLTLAPVSAVIAPDVGADMGAMEGEAAAEAPTTERRLPQVRAVPDSRSN